ncbi:hypothetical protein B5180_09770 [Streptomyces sp. BF-3]|nr:hypothetical protein B5180_09770 [Streptomyces sp. BF-3]
MPDHETYLLPASFGQERLWLHERSGLREAIYNVAGGLRFRGALDVDLLQRCLNAIVERHEVLRTVFRLSDGEVVQMVGPSAEVRVRLVDASGDVDAMLRELSVEAFDLAEGPLFRCHLLDLGTGEHILYVVLHHIVSDGRSRDVLLGELSELYAAGEAGREPELPELEVQYGDFAAWQRQVLESDALDDQLAHWRERMYRAPDLVLPQDHVRPSRPTHTVGSAEVAVPAQVVEELHRAAGGLTPFMIAVAGYAALLSRWSGQSSVVVAMPVSGREEPELLGLVGFFVNTVPVRIDLDGDPSLAEILRHTRERCLEAFAHAAVPFERLMDEVRPQRGGGRLPLARAWAVLQETMDLPPLFDRKVTPVLPPGEGYSPFDVLLELWSEGGALTGRLSCAADAFTRGTTQDVARTFEAILGSPASTTLSELPFLVRQSDPVTEPEAVRAAVGEPDSAVEQLLAQLWTEVLEVDGVSVEDEFYASGGNSLRAIQVMTRARDHGVEIPVDLVLGEHTIRDLARRDTAQEPDADQRPLPVPGPGSGGREASAAPAPGTEAR